MRKMNMNCWLKSTDSISDLHLLVYYNINIPLLMGVYNNLFGYFLKKAGVDPTQFDLMAGMDEHLEYAPDIHLRELQHEFSKLDTCHPGAHQQSSYTEFQQMPDIPIFREKSLISWFVLVTYRIAAMTSLQSPGGRSLIW